MVTIPQIFSETLGFYWHSEAVMRSLPLKRGSTCCWQFRYRIDQSHKGAVPTQCKQLIWLQTGHIELAKYLYSTGVNSHPGQLLRISLLHFRFQNFVTRWNRFLSIAIARSGNADVTIYFYFGLINGRIKINWSSINVVSQNHSVDQRRYIETKRIRLKTDILIGNQQVIH